MNPWIRSGPIDLGLLAEYNRNVRNSIDEYHRNPITDVMSVSLNGPCLRRCGRQTRRRDGICIYCHGFTPKKRKKKTDAATD